MVGGLLAPLHRKIQSGGDHLAKGVELAQRSSTMRRLPSYEGDRSEPEDARVIRTAVRVSARRRWRGVADFAKAIEGRPKDTLAWTRKPGRS